MDIDASQPALISIKELLENGRFAMEEFFPEISHAPVNTNSIVLHVLLQSS